MRHLDQFETAQHLKHQQIWLRKCQKKNFFFWSPKSGSRFREMVGTIDLQQRFSIWENLEI